MSETGSNFKQNSFILDELPPPPSIDDYEKAPNISKRGTFTKTELQKQESFILPPAPLIASNSLLNIMVDIPPPLSLDSDETESRLSSTKRAVSDTKLYPKDSTLSNDALRLTQAHSTETFHTQKEVTHAANIQAVSKFLSSSHNSIASSKMRPYLSIHNFAEKEALLLDKTIETMRNSLDFGDADRELGMRTTSSFKDPGVTSVSVVVYYQETGFRTFHISGKTSFKQILDKMLPSKMVINNPDDIFQIVAVDRKGDEEILPLNSLVETVYQKCNKHMPKFILRNSTLDPDLTTIYLSDGTFKTMNISVFTPVRRAIELMCKELGLPTDEQSLKEYSIFKTYANNGNSVEIT
jgi:hypothetical protein